MHNWMRAEPIDVTVRRLAKYGYESIEISGEPYLYNTKDVRKVLKDNGIKCWGSVTLMLGDRNLVQERTRAPIRAMQVLHTMVKS
jgi:sugar phosphate isomerase/epimerase